MKYYFFDKLLLYFLGPFFIGLVIFISLVIINYLFFLWDGLKPFLRILIILLTFTQFFSYTYTALINPGIRIDSIPAQSFTDQHKICPKCYIVSLKVDKVEHCKECDVCIEERDHHCPWVTKCVGKNNLISFYVFVGSSLCLILSLYAGAFCFIFTN